MVPLPLTLLRTVSRAVAMKLVSVPGGAVSLNGVVQSCITGHLGFLIPAH